MEKELETGEKTENKTDNKTEQNNRRYKAFISYRHQPFDRKSLKKRKNGEYFEMKRNCRQVLI